MKIIGIVKIIIFVLKLIGLNRAELDQPIDSNKINDQYSEMEEEYLDFEINNEHCSAEGKEYLESNVNDEYKELDKMGKRIANNKMNKEDTSYIDSVIFKYWNHSLAQTGTTVNFNNEIELKGIWLKEMPLKVIIHGWHHTTPDKSGIFIIKKAYLDSKEEIYNVITFDWRLVANHKRFLKVARESVKIGIILGNFLINLAALDIVKPSDIHMLGNSMGAHIAGIAGNTFFNVTGKKIYRITGLDPASPGYKGSWCLWSESEVLKADDAIFVDVIHTAGGLLAMHKPMGHVDFYPNNGRSPQPMCTSIYIPWKRISCSHASAYEYYYESVANPKSFESVECSSMKVFKDGKCDGNHKNFMGHSANDKYLARKLIKKTKCEICLSGIRNIEEIPVISVQYN